MWQKTVCNQPADAPPEGDAKARMRCARNTTGGGPGRKPLFAGAAGVTVLASPTAQYISGADALDWNGDRDLDLLTGQGHGGSGLRFFERDYLNDFVNKTFPLVTVERE